MRGPSVDRTGELYDDDAGRRFELLSCGHAGPPSSCHAKTARCIVCGDAPAWKLKALGWLEDGADAVSEGRRLMVIAELEQLEIPVPDALLEQRHTTALHRVTTTTTRPNASATVVDLGDDGSRAP